MSSEDATARARRLIDALNFCVDDGPDSVTPDLLEQAADSLETLVAALEAAESQRDAYHQQFERDARDCMGLRARVRELEAKLEAAESARGQGCEHCRCTCVSCAPCGESDGDSQG